MDQTLPSETLRFLATNDTPRGPDPNPFLVAYTAITVVYALSALLVFATLFWGALRAGRKMFEHALVGLLVCRGLSRD